MSERSRRSVEWMSQGACQQHEDPELFFPVAVTGPALSHIQVAKAVCWGCTVRVMCLSYALETGQEGIWGGTTREERNARRRRRSRPSRTRPHHEDTAARWQPRRPR